MLRKDLLMRQFEEFGKVLAVILGFKMQKDWENFEKEIEEASKKFTPFEVSAVENFSLEEFQTEIVNNSSLLPEHYKILADLLFEKMKYHLELDKNEGANLLKLKCILLYKKFSENFTHNEFNMDVHYKLDFLQKMN
ncbi:MAG: hypothetical protein JWO32_2751 [Bacteroidetes bacterium]|nr:hypothetical protein [Bacteroidota bacterium]